jgi:hypothetical protein
MSTCRAHSDPFMRLSTVYSGVARAAAWAQRVVGAREIKERAPFPSRPLHSLSFLLTENIN